ncbi:uncharacterized protein EI90DRAFT_1194517 [Cantharellus anzutake]|uniref:uncharacterized protein n=1 Tax=Cantharellus anzutake TaxID=1750568 RepID=UPI00190677FB|nr:uncharacterized protein EI90DRAFT_1194517 [Cantharellus anzutake]KAF8330450.1 hypothetical protein EI90DRAFT_1194517 [Cantharellus anzutake]
MNPFDLTAHHSESGSDENAGASPLSTNSGDQDYNHFGPPSYRGEGKKFQCPRCDASFTRPSSLRQHLLIHTGEKPIFGRIESQTPLPLLRRRQEPQSTRESFQQDIR